MGWVRLIGSAIDRLISALVFGRTPRLTLSAEAWRMAKYGSPAEREEGERLVTLIDRLPFNSPGHCEWAFADHVKFWRGVIAQVDA